MNASKVNFNIKLLSGNNVVLVECDGFDTELFMPKISHGRIGLQNIIPNRRCCYLMQQADYNADSIVKSNYSSTNSLLHKIKKSRNRNPFQSIHNNSSIINSGNASEPKAFSTPNKTNMHNKILNKNTKNTKSNDKENIRSCLKRTNSPDKDSSICVLTPKKVLHEIPSPELPRSSATLPTPQEVVREILLDMPPRLRLKNLLRQTSFDDKRSPFNEQNKSNDNKPARSPINIAHNSSNNTSDFKLPETPKQLNKSPINALAKNQNQIQNFSFIKANKNYETPPKWRKCITPVRTYTRKTQTQLRRSSSSILPKQIKAHKMNKVIPTYLINPTQGRKGTHKIEIRKRKLIVDEKTAVSPPTKPIQNVNTKERLLAKKKDYENSKRCAFDLLTNANKQRTMSAKLNQQFRKNCVNKISTTYPKYKPLCTLPPFETGGGGESAHEGKSIEVKNKSPIKKTPSEEQHEKRRQLVAAVEKTNIQKSKNFIQQAIVSLH